MNQNWNIHFFKHKHPFTLQNVLILGSRWKFAVESTKLYGSAFNAFQLRYLQGVSFVFVKSF